MIQKIVSGGQTGADRAGLDAAMEAGIQVGGCCPKGRLAEDGIVPDIYPFIELIKGGYKAHTEKNVIESDGTLILNIGKEPKPEIVNQWLEGNDILILNVARPRESRFPQGIYQQSVEFLRVVLSDSPK